MTMSTPVVNRRPRVQIASPLLFESEEEVSDEESCTDAKYLVEPTKEEKLVKNLQTILMGIPPPPAFTVPQLDSREILKLWRENQSFRLVPSPSKDKQDAARNVESAARTTVWPEIMKVDHWDVYYNKSSASEELARLNVKYKERYVGAETSSCVNALFVKSPVRTASARKRARTRAWGHSPGRRLSHLARRRKAFSSASLCSVAGNKNPDKKMIMVEIKKIGNRQNKKNSAKKSKPTPKKTNDVHASNYKRALFQSPDQPGAKELQTPNTQTIQRSKRNLFSDSSEKKINENGKRERPMPRRISPRKRVNRSLSFQESNQVTTTQTRGQQTSQAQLTLTGAHKQKMLWAVTNALRDEGMGMNHDLFRPSMSVLFKACQRLWLTCLSKQSLEGSTSENMLALTKRFSAYTIKQINDDPTSEHMALVCTNIIRMAEKEELKSKAECETVSSMCAKEYSSRNTKKTPSKSTPLKNTAASQEKLRRSARKCSQLSDTSKLNCDTNERSAIVDGHKRTPRKVTIANNTHVEALRRPSRLFSEPSTSTSDNTNPIIPDLNIEKQTPTKTSVTPLKSKPSEEKLRRSARKISLFGSSSKLGSEKQNCTYVEDNKQKHTPAKVSSGKNTQQELRRSVRKCLLMNDPSVASNNDTNTQKQTKASLFIDSNKRTDNKSKIINNQTLNQELKLSKQVQNLSSPKKRCETRTTSTEVSNSVLIKSSTLKTNKETPSLSQNTDLVSSESPDFTSPTTRSKTKTSLLNKKTDEYKNSTLPYSMLTTKPSSVCLDASISKNSDVNTKLEEIQNFGTCAAKDQEPVKSSLLSPVFFDCSSTSQLENVDIEKENVCSKKTKNELVEKTIKNVVSSQRCLISLENTSQPPLLASEPVNRTLQRYRLGNGREMEVEPPKLVPHWEQEFNSEDAHVPKNSPPKLTAHWEATSSGSKSNLPDSIMNHWQQLFNNAVTSDKIMFDFEDTSYEIKLPTLAEEDSRASSICAPFDFPHLVDDSKSCFNSVFTKFNSDN